ATIVELLEDRCLLSGCTVSWSTSSDGFWDEPSNWNSGTVPGPTDDVCIDQPSHSVVVTHRQSSEPVRSLYVAESLIVSDGTLEIATTLQIDGTLGIALPGTVVVDGTLTNLSNDTLT